MTLLDDLKQAGLRVRAASALYDALQDALPILVWAASNNVTGAREALEAARAALTSADGGDQ